MKSNKKIFLLPLILSLVVPMASFAQEKYSAQAGTTIELQGVSAETEKGSQAQVQIEDQSRTGSTDQEAEVTSSDSAQAQKSFVLPHVLESSGVLVAAGDIDGDGFKGLKLFVDANGDGKMEANEVSLSADESLSQVLVVNGSEVRGWDPKTKEAVAARLQANDAKNNANDFGLYVAQKAIENDKIENITVTEEGLDMKNNKSNNPAVSISYNATIKFLGIFNVNVPAVASIDASEKTNVDYRGNWLINLLSIKGNQSIYTNLALDIKVARDQASGLATGK